MLAYADVFFKWYGHHQDLHVLTHSFPTRRSSDLAAPSRVRLHARRGRARLPRRVHGRADRRRCFGVRGLCRRTPKQRRSEEHTSELQSLMRISYAVFCLTNKKTKDLAHKK